MEGEIEEPSIADVVDSDMRSSSRKLLPQKSKSKAASCVAGSDCAGEPGFVASAKVGVGISGGRAKMIQKKSKEQGKSTTGSIVGAGLNDGDEDADEVGNIDRALTGKEVKERCIIVRTYLDRNPAESGINVNCRVENLASVTDGFGSQKVRWLKDMGMNSLRFPKGMKLPRKLCYWLAAHVDVGMKALVVGDLVFPLSKFHLNHVLGLPLGKRNGRGGKVVPNKEEGENMIRSVQELKKKYKAPRGTNGLSRRKVEAAVKSADIGEQDFKEAFLLLALGDVLCPTTSHTISNTLLPAAAVAIDAKDYDWCQFVFNHWLEAMSNFSSRFSANGYSAGCGGCSIFLAIFYLDRVKRSPVNWGHLPRVQAWDPGELSRAKKADENPGGDYGKLGCFNVAYGEIHPLQPRDFALPMNDNDLLQKLLAVVNEAMCVRGDVTQNPPCLGLAGRKRKKKCSRVKQPRRLKATKKRKRMEVSEIPVNVGAENNGLASSSTQVVDGNAAIYESRNMTGPVLQEAAERQVVPSEPQSLGVPEVGNSLQIDVNVVNESTYSVSALLNEDISRTNMEPADINLGDRSLFLDMLFADLSPKCTDPLPSQYGIECDRVAGLGGGCSNNVNAGQNCMDACSCDVVQLGTVGFQLPLSEQGSDIFGESGGAAGLLGSQDADVQVCGRFSPPGHCFGLHQVVDGNGVSFDGEMARTPSPRTYGNEAHRNHLIGESSLGSSCSKQNGRSPRNVSLAYWEAWRGWPYNSLLIAVVKNAGLNPLSPETVFLRVDGVTSTLAEFSGLVKQDCVIDDNYVRVAGLLYQKVWDAYFPDRTRRVFLDPDFGSSVLNLADGDKVGYELMQRCSARLGAIDLDRLNVIMVPVRENSHWWCAVFSITGRVIGIIDSLDTVSAHEKHKGAIMNLAKGLDQLITFAHPTWTDGQCSSFTTFTVPVVAHDEMFHNGLEMLLAIKRVAYRLHEEIHLGFVSEECRWLVHEDVMSRFNVERRNVLILLQRRLKLILVCVLPRSLCTFQHYRRIRCKYY